MISKIVVKNKSGNKNYLLKDKEAYIVAASEIEYAHGLPIYIATFTNELQQVLRVLCKQIVDNWIKPQSAQMYARRVIQHVNVE